MNKKRKLLSSALVAATLSLGLTSFSAQDAHAAQGWTKENNTWYYYNNNGDQVKNSWVGAYYLKDNGKMAASEWIYDNYYKAWYYLNSNGSYARNTWVGNYYLGSDGKMVTNSWVDNNRYYVGANGAWIKDYQNNNTSTQTGPIGEGTIKGNIDSGIYHLPGQRDYNKIRPEHTRYFKTEDEARAAGFRRALR